MGKLTIVFCDLCKKTCDNLTKQFNLINNSEKHVHNYKICDNCFSKTKGVLDTAFTPSHMASDSSIEPLEIKVKVQEKPKKKRTKAAKKPAKSGPKKIKSTVKELHDGEFKVPSNAGLVDADVVKSFGAGCKHEKKSFDPEEGGLFCKECGEKLAMV
jgi:hypothetical protein